MTAHGPLFEKRLDLLHERRHAFLETRTGERTDLEVMPPLEHELRPLDEGLPCPFRAELGDPLEVPEEVRPADINFVQGGPAVPGRAGA